jgi:PBP1b-binding outer membrane lipoprotein LpoB
MQSETNLPIHPKSCRNHYSIVVALLALLLAGCSALSACSLLRQQVPTPTPQVMHVTADEIALAMQEDHFFSDYDPYSLIVQGVVTDVRQENKDYMLEMATQIDTKVWCDFGGQAPDAKAGDSIEVLSAHASQAQRQPNAVLLADCSIP